ncbi:hypothetical protein DB31_3521 [Hyalangium minutum]|uniref:Uncharacterized protein n=1 Tax=Hyalangium minutum TaxID=394096 RepID=A0A085WUM8_9BACT|nr:hypothetical protein DB31_3521 [Hyalangium minutum]
MPLQRNLVYDRAHRFLGRGRSGLKKGKGRQGGQEVSYARHRDLRGGTG